MIFQVIFYIFSYILSYLPTLIFLGFDIAILVFGIRIYKRNSYKYGRYLMISSIIAIVSTIINISTNLRHLLPILEEEIGLFAALLTYSILSWILFGLEFVSMVFLFLSVFHIYKTHEKNRNEEKYEL